MTVVIATAGKNFVVVGADTRGVVKDKIIGDRIESDSAKKIFTVANHVMITIAGNGDVGTQLIEKFKSDVIRNTDGVTKVTNLFSKFCKNEIYGTGFNYEERIPDVDFIITGLDKNRSKYTTPMIYTLDSVNGFAIGRRDYYAILGKFFIPYYIFRKDFKQDSDLRTLPGLVAKAIYETSQCDSDVGNKMRIFIVEEGGYRELPREDVLELYSTWDENNIRQIIEG